MCPPYRHQPDAERGGDQAHDLLQSLLQVVGVGERHGGHEVLQRRGLGSGDGGAGKTVDERDGDDQRHLRAVTYRDQCQPFIVTGAAPVR
jgi:hypothetical protein